MKELVRRVEDSVFDRSRKKFERFSINRGTEVGQTCRFLDLRLFAEGKGGGKGALFAELESLGHRGKSKKCDRLLGRRE